MKKFSKITGSQVKSEPKTEENEEVNKINSIKAKLIKLMNDFLKIQSVGAARTELINTSISITGKEILADAILDLIMNEFNSEKMDLLESLKLEINDWFTLDKKINQINTQIIQEKDKTDLNIERKLVTFLELYSDSKEFDFISENYCERFKNNIDIERRILVAQSILENDKYNNLQKDKLKILMNKFKKRIG